MQIFIINNPLETASVLDKRRLYTKNPVFYQRWKGYGESYDNWYWVDGIWKKYPQK